MKGQSFFGRGSKIVFSTYVHIIWRYTHINNGGAILGVATLNVILNHRKMTCATFSLKYLISKVPRLLFHQKNNQNYHFYSKEQKINLMFFFHI